ncbi:MAG: hypothetical protein ACTHYC_05740 [Sphingobacterium sp.]
MFGIFHTKLKLRLRFTLFLLFIFFTGMRSPQKATVLDSHVTMRVYGAERLESVIFRLQVNADIKIGFTPQQLSGYMAKSADYDGVTLRTVLEEQLEGTPFEYRLLKYRKKHQHLELYTPEDTDKKRHNRR